MLLLKAFGGRLAFVSSSVCVCARLCVCVRLITVPEAYCNYSLDVCLQALSPCGVGLMPTVLGLVYVAARIDPQPQSRAQHWPTSCCKHLPTSYSCLGSCVYTRACVHALHVFMGSVPNLTTEQHIWSGLHHPGHHQEVRAAAFRAAVLLQRLTSFC